MKISIEGKIIEKKELNLENIMGTIGYVSWERKKVEEIHFGKGKISSCEGKHELTKIT